MNHNNQNRDSDVKKPEEKMQKPKDHCLDQKNQLQRPWSLLRLLLKNSEGPPYLHPFWLPISSYRLRSLQKMLDLGNARLQKTATQKISPRIWYTISSLLSAPTGVSGYASLITGGTHVHPTTITTQMGTQIDTRTRTPQWQMVVIGSCRNC